MQQTKKKKTGKYLGYTSYGVLITLVFLVYRFPSDILTSYIETRVNKNASQYRFIIQDIRPSFPTALNFMKSEVILNTNSNTSSFKVDRLIVKPDLFSLIQGRFRYLLDCKAYKGSIKGYLEFLNNNFKAPFSTAFDIINIKLEKNPLFGQLIGADLIGDLAGDISFDASPKAMIDSSGIFNLRFTDGNLDLVKPVFSIDVIKFDELIISIELKKRSIEITKFILKGPEINGSLIGTIYLRNNFSKSRLNLEGDISPLIDITRGSKRDVNTLRFYKQFLEKENFSFRIHGTIKAPKFKPILS